MKNSNRLFYIALCCWWLAACGSLEEQPGNSESVTVAHLPEQMDDATVAADQTAFVQAEQRLAKLNDNGDIPAWNYHYHKTRTWLEFARAEYDKNDRAGTADQALTRVIHLLVSLENGNRHLPLATPLISNSRPIREDLWMQANQWKQHPGFACAMPEIAEMEVTLVRAGHEEKTLGWRRAYRQIQAADRLAQRVPKLLSACLNIVLPRHITASLASEQKFVLPKAIYFGLDQRNLDANSQDKLNRVASVLQANPRLTLSLHGHADQTASQSYNLGLAETRAKVVQRYLEGRGIDWQRLRVKNYGEYSPLEPGCSAAALAANRRVELVYLNPDNVPLKAEHLGGIKVEQIPGGAQCDER